MVKRERNLKILDHTHLRLEQNLKTEHWLKLQ